MCLCGSERSSLHSLHVWHYRFLTILLKLVLMVGLSDQPKGIQRPVGGHIATLTWSMSVIYGMTPNDVWWAASDLGWVVGHSYICYGPLLYGITSVMYEGKPDRTPNPGQYFR
jgi:propionyl-CoA synthetase